MKPRLLVVNPNTSAAITQRMVTVARRVAGARAEIRGVTAPFGAPALESEADLELARRAVLAMVSAFEEVDGVLVAAFGDPGLDLVRAYADVAAEGLGEAGLLASAEGGRPFAILTLGPALGPGILSRVAALGLAQQLVGLDFLSCGVLDLAADPERFVPEILDRVAACVQHQGAEAVLLAGAPFAGFAADLAARTAVPLQDGLTAGIERLISRLGGGNGRSGAASPH